MLYSLFNDSSRKQKEQNEIFLAGIEGFTLLEILVAIFIFAIVATTIYSSFNAVIGGIGAIEQSSAEYDMGKTCLNRMISDISALYLILPPEYKEPEFNDNPDPYRLLGEKTNVDGIDFSKLRFTAISHLPMEGDPRTGIAQIVYYVQKASEDQYILKRSDTLYPFAEFEENALDPILCEHLTGLEIVFYDDDGGLHDYWDSDSTENGYGTPRAVKITLKIGDESHEILLQTMICLPVMREKKAT